jgi:hypothetical protein
MDMKPLEGKVMVARHDGQTPIILTWKDEQVPFRLDKCGIPVYVTEKEHARVIIKAKPEHYRLYKSKPLDAQFTTLNGAIKWGTITPYTVQEQLVQTGVDPDNNEAIYDKRVIWIEDPEGKYAISATPENITGEKPKVDPTEFGMKVLQKENEELKDAVSGLTEIVKKLQEEIAASKSQNKGTGK